MGKVSLAKLYEVESRRERERTQLLKRKKSDSTKDGNFRPTKRKIMLITNGENMISENIWDWKKKKKGKNAVIKKKKRLNKRWKFRPTGTRDKDKLMRQYD